MRNNIHPLQAPFKPQNLLSTSEFCSYCQGYNVFIRESDLEQLHKRKLFFPALKLYVGYEEFVKINLKQNNQQQCIYRYPEQVSRSEKRHAEKTKYYRHAGYSYSTQEDLLWYEERNMLRYPSCERFSSWQQLAEPNFTKDKQKVAKNYVYLYDKRQFYALKIILKDNTIFSFLRKPASKKEQLLLAEDLQQYYQFIRCYNEAEDLYRKEKQNENKRLEKYIRENSFPKMSIHQKETAKKEAKKDFKSNFDQIAFPKLQKKAQKIIKVHNLTVEDIRKWRDYFSQNNIFYQVPYASKIMRKYIQGMSEKTLIRAEDANYIVLMLNQFLYLLTGEEVTVKEVIGRLYRHFCPICQQVFQPRNRLQITCGKQTCVQQSRNINRQERRKRKKQN